MWQSQTAKQITKLQLKTLVIFDEQSNSWEDFLIFSMITSI